MRRDRSRSGDEGAHSDHDTIDDLSSTGSSLRTRSEVTIDTMDDGDNGGNGGSRGGGSGNPIPLMHSQGDRKETIYTAKAAGTTFIEAANNGTADNLWTNFPWEFPRFYISNDEFQQMYSTHLYWKCEHLKITFKNPVCIQEIGTGITQTGVNSQAQLFGYSDVNYMTGVNDKPGAHANTLTGAEFNNWMLSWRQHGYVANVPHPMQQTDIPDKLFTSIDPDIKEIGMGPGQAMEFQWNIKNDYWRGTTEFAASGPITATERMPRFDPYMGYVANFNQIGAALGAGQDIMYVSPHSAVNRGDLTGFSMDQVLIGSASGGTNTFPTVVPYACGDPIPKIWLNLQPQLSTFTSGTGRSMCQLQFELSMKMRLMGRVPRRNRIEAWGSNDMYHSEYGQGRIATHTVPVFKPAMSNYNGA